MNKHLPPWLAPAAVSAVIIGLFVWRTAMEDRMLHRELAGYREYAACRESGKGAIMTNVECTHLDLIRDVKPRTRGCEECLQTGDEWVHLRLCLVCGHVGCCDSSKNKHATKHFHASSHPVMKSAEPGENWGWCYVDEVELVFA